MICAAGRFPSAGAVCRVANEAGSGARHSSGSIQPGAEAGGRSGARLEQRRRLQPSRPGRRPCPGPRLPEAGDRWMATEGICCLPVL